MRINVLISGKVQGVFFRAQTKEKAEELGLDGWVRNLTDGRVEAVFSGPKEKVEEMVRWCRQGPPSSKVEKVSTFTQDTSAKQGKLKGFEIKY